MLLVPFAALLQLLLLQLHLMLLPRKLLCLLMGRLLLLEVLLLLGRLLALLHTLPLLACGGAKICRDCDAWLHQVCQLLLLLADQRQH